MSKGAIIAIVFVVAVAGLIWASLRGVNEVTCEVCITYNEETACRTGKGRTKEDAIDVATRSACAVLSSGMTESMKCERTTPTSQSCD